MNLIFFYFRDLNAVTDEILRLEDRIPELNKVKMSFMLQVKFEASDWSAVHQSMPLSHWLILDTPLFKGCL